MKRFVVGIAVMMLLCFAGCVNHPGAWYQGSDEGYYYTTGDYGDHTYNFQGPLFGAHSPGTTEWYPGRGGNVPERS